jgi:hypothetical protein
MLATTERCATRPDLLTPALEYVRRGWAVIPTIEKRPAVPWKPYQTQRPSRVQVYEWFGNNGLRPTGIAVILGEVSGGLCCFDFDRLDAYESWAGQHPDLAAQLPTVATARGRHVYFRSRWSGFRALADGELRGDSKHYCLLPPSVHPSGLVYSWQIGLPDGPLPELDPAALSDRAPYYICSSRPPIASICSVCSVSSVAVTPEIEAAIRATLPTGPGQRNRMLFIFIRRLKADPALRNLPPKVFRDVVRRWHELALPYIRSKDFSETWGDFVYGWKRARFPQGVTIRNIVKDADPTTLPAELLELYDSPHTLRLIAVCRELQRASGNNAFFLSVRKAAELIGTGVRSAWRQLEMLCADGVLQKVQPGSKSRATRYRYLGYAGTFNRD